MRLFGTWRSIKDIFPERSSLYTSKEGLNDGNQVHLHV